MGSIGGANSRSFDSLMRSVTRYFFGTTFCVTSDGGNNEPGIDKSDMDDEADSDKGESGAYSELEEYLDDDDADDDDDFSESISFALFSIPLVAEINFFSKSN